MGMTPLEGLVMGTRSGDIDPMVIDYISHKEGLNLEQMLSILNKNSGLLGISGLTNDRRTNSRVRRTKIEEQNAIDAFAIVATPYRCISV